LSVTYLIILPSSPSLQLTIPITVNMLSKRDHHPRDNRKVKKTTRSVRYRVQLWIQTIAQQDGSNYKFIP